MIVADIDKERASRSTTRRLWLFRPPRLVAYENIAVGQNLLVPSFGVHADLSDHFDYGDVLREVEEANPRESRRKIEGWANQLHTLLHQIQPGDLIVVPLKRSGGYGIAIAKRDCGVTDDGETGREVEWLKPSDGSDGPRIFPQAAFLPDLIHSFNSQLHICAITRNDAMNRIMAVIEHGQDPGPAGHSSAHQDFLPEEFERHARFRMLAKIGTAFAGHDMAMLVAAILELDGYVCRISPPGPDGGVDILAGKGIAGLTDGLVVQVKSGDIVADGPTYQQLLGAMNAHGVPHGLLVSWSGVTRTVRAKAAEQWFKVRIWDGSDVLKALLDRYDDLPLEIRDRLGFRKVMFV